MQKNKATTSRNKATAFIDFKPAELRLGKQWLMVYYIKNPLTQSMERERVTVPKAKSKKERLEIGKKMVLDCNDKLKKGWNPYLNNPLIANQYKDFQTVKDLFIKQTELDVKKEIKRPDTLRTYKSFLSMISEYSKSKEVELQYIYQLNKIFVVNYLDWILYDRENSPRTHNNHLSFIVTFEKFCIARGFLNETITAGIVTKQENEKIRQVLSDSVKEKVRKIEFEDFHYYVVLGAFYYCHIRRTEMTKLKLSNINLLEQYIFVPKSISKNKKDEYTTIPNAYIEILKKHCENASANDYLFSANNFKPGAIQLQPKKISDNWAKIRKSKEIDKIYQAYGFKDTGITDLLNSGVAAIKVRDQARHHDIKITEKYTPRNKNSDDTIKNANVIF
jgi:integrase/recombinase XerD